MESTKRKSSITDTPRNAFNDDKDTFGIEPYEKGLTRFINHTSTPITIALQGEWGSGKTSLMNSLHLRLGAGEHAKYHAVWLNTWEHALMTDAASTLLDIITCLIRETTAIAKTDETKTRKIINKLWNVGKVTAKFAAKTAADKVVEGSSELVDNILSSEGKSSIGEVRNELENIIAECIKKDGKEGFIFFIDDLDRIDPPVAVQLLELLKNIFTIKNCIFILAIDYDVVVKGLEPKFGKLSEKNEREFRSFFDKIIQVPFSMPVTSYKVDDFLKTSLLSTGYLNEKQAKSQELIAHFSEISNLSVGTNPRSLKRLLNSLSLISCINSATQKEDNAHLDNELDLLVNFTLVSIQIAFPPVYKLLNAHPGFDKWDQTVAMQMNLSELSDEVKTQLEKSEEFDEEWEQVLFRLCEKDHYLKKRSLNISRLLNSLRKAILADQDENNESTEIVEEAVSSVISLSSVTNVEAFDKPPVDYHRSGFLKKVRRSVIPKLKANLPDIASLIKPQGKRVQTNAFIKFTEKDWQKWIRLYSFPKGQKVRLVFLTEQWIAPTKGEKLDTILKNAGQYEAYQKIKEDWNAIGKKLPDFGRDDFPEAPVKNGRYVVVLLSYLTLPSTDDFFKEENLIKLGSVIAEMYRVMVRIQEISGRHFH